eukprot:GHVL01003676.1.p1 GENE.GHVL01003676.1~~GHVL01003676.1.p1  ORF type:complete len:166 (-),score=24.65 GHVL01003676.1:70-567(-)
MTLINCLLFAALLSETIFCAIPVPTTGRAQLLNSSSSSNDHLKQALSMYKERVESSSDSSLVSKHEFESDSGLSLLQKRDNETFNDKAASARVALDREVGRLAKAEEAMEQQQRMFTVVVLGLISGLLLIGGLLYALSLKRIQKIAHDVLSKNRNDSFGTISVML